MVGSTSWLRGITHRTSARARDASVDDGDGARPAGGTAAHFYWKAAHRESFRRQRFAIVQLLDVAIADLAAGLVAFPEQAGIAGGEIFLPGVDEGRVPAPAVGAGDAYAALEQMERGLAAHAAALRHVVRPSIGRARAGVHQHDLQRSERMSDALELGCDVARGRDIAVGKMPE